MKGRQLGSVEWAARIQRAVAQILKNSPVDVVGAAFGNDLDLPSRRPAGLGGIHRRAHTKFGDCICGDEKPALALPLVANGCGINTIDTKIVVVSAAAYESDAGPIAGSRVDSAWN